MKAGRGSRTAVMVCSWRAMAHGTSSVTKFSDPTALALLPDEARARVEEARSGRGAKGLRAGIARAVLERRVQMMVARTVTIDDAVREAASPQVVILGAGLDGRAFRMEELRDAIVFEVDHPDSQREKRARVGALTKRAREVRFVPVDFTRDRLEDALEAAGHDPARPTTWIWEGVVMYLTPAEVEATVAVVARRSAPKSRLVVLYHSEGPMLHLVGFLVRLVGEPLRSVFSPEAMRTLLSSYGFGVVRDDDLPAIGRALSPEVARGTRRMTHTRIAIADFGR